MADDMDDARQWHEMADHLVHGHSADPDRLISYAPTLEQHRFRHADTHVALAVTGTEPPDGHVHSAAIRTGWPTAYESSYRPFGPSVTAAADPADRPLPHQTGIHHHMSQLAQADTNVAWSLLARQLIRPEDLADVRAERQERAEFPRPVHTQSGIRSTHGTTPLRRHTIHKIRGW